MSHASETRETYQGHCHCCKIQFQVQAPTEMCSHCHCESCRRTHGAAFVTWTSVSDSQFKILKGEEHVGKYESSSDIFWMSCTHCFSPLFQTTRHSPGRTYINLAAFDDAIDRLPESHVSIEEKVSWIEISDKLPQFKEKASDKS